LVEAVDPRVVDVDPDPSGDAHSGAVHEHIETRVEVKDKRLEVFGL
jgi:hypothetical protein